MGKVRFLRGKPVSRLERRIGYRFKNTELLERALRHRSWSFDDGNAILNASNERLEFLGDAVLGLLVAEHLFREFPGRTEGELTESRRLLVNGEFLAQRAEELDLGCEILLSASEEETGGREKQSILSDAYEALLGAIYIDGGFKAAKKFVEEKHLADRDEQLNSEKYINFKGTLLEYLQARGKRPEYRIISENGPDHNKTFVAAVSVAGKEIGRGSGPTKKAAEQKASKEALEKITR
ncbi:ribonuclease III [bacterium]|nr:MAG: ribonuclease III [bacterium]